MAYERVVERFLDAKHDHIAAYTVETRGHRRPKPDKDPMLLTALAYEIEDFLGSLPKKYRTAELRGRLIYEFLRQVPRRLRIFCQAKLTNTDCRALSKSLSGRSLIERDGSRRHCGPAHTPLESADGLR